MLKTSNDVDGEIVRPFVVLVLALKQLEYLTQEEFTYLLPLITTSRKFRTIVDCIKRLRKGDITIDEIIVDTLLTMENYREARLYLLERPVSEHVICQAGINRKSRQYDSTYYRSTALSSHWIETTLNPFSICYKPAGTFASVRCGATTFSKRRTGEK